MIPRNASKKWQVYGVVFVLALGFRLGYEALVWSGPLGNPDSPAYEDLATSILHSQPYETNESAGPGGFPSGLQRPPGYPAYLAAVSFPAGAAVHNRHWISLAQCLTGALFALLLAILVSALAGPTVGAIAACLFAVDWITIVHTPLVISETVYSVTLGLAIVVYGLALSRQRASLALLAGCLLGGAALVKPATQVLVFAFLIGWLFWKPRRWIGLLFLVTYMACVLPWMARNQRKYHVFALSRIDVTDLYFYIAQGSLHSYPVSDVAGGQITADVNRLDLQWRAKNLSADERSRQMTHEALALISTHWPAVIKQSSIGLARTTLGTASVTAADSMNPPPGRAARLLLNIIPLVEICALWMLTIYGCIASATLSRGLKIFLAVSVLCVLLPAAAPLGQSRFRVPAMPALCILAAAGAATLLSRYDAQRVS